VSAWPWTTRLTGRIDMMHSCSGILCGSVPDLKALPDVRRVRTGTFGRPCARLIQWSLAAGPPGAVMYCPSKPGVRTRERALRCGWYFHESTPCRKLLESSEPELAQTGFLEAQPPSGGELLPLRVRVAATLLNPFSACSIAFCTPGRVSSSTSPRPRPPTRRGKRLSPAPLSGAASRVVGQASPARPPFHLPRLEFRVPLVAEHRAKCDPADTESHRFANPHLPTRSITSSDSASSLPSR